MEKYRHIEKIKNIYAEGGNVIKHLKAIEGNEVNSIEDILISYDFQAGTYISNIKGREEYTNSYSSKIANVIDGLGHFDSLIEVGVGEATTLAYVLKYLNNKPNEVIGFDISWSRLKYAKEFLQRTLNDNIRLFTANLFDIPLKDNSVDIVYTSHSLEPNGGKEKEALLELYRIAKKYVVLLEPSFEFANEAAKQRMIQNGYITELYTTAKNLNLKIIEHRLFDYCSNELNPTGLMIIEKVQPFTNDTKLICPISKTELFPYNDSFMYSKESFLAFPILERIPCLLKENAILATHLLANYDDLIA